jgi:hypothetical protein
VVVVNPKSNGLSGTAAGGAAAGVLLFDSLVADVVAVKADELAFDVEVGTVGIEAGGPYDSARAGDGFSARFSLGRRSSTLGLKNLLAAPLSITCSMLVWPHGLGTSPPGCRFALTTRNNKSPSSSAFSASATSRAGPSKARAVLLLPASVDRVGPRLPLFA